MVSDSLAIRMRRADVSRALLLLVALVAALVGIAARPATGEEASASRGSASRPDDDERATISIATQAQHVETFVLRKVTMDAHERNAGATAYPYPTAKRFVARSGGPEEQLTDTASTGELRWRSSTPQHFDGIGDRPSAVQRTAHSQRVTSEVQVGATESPRLRRLPPWEIERKRPTSKAHYDQRFSEESYLAASAHVDAARRVAGGVRQAQASRITQPGEGDVFGGDDPPTLDVPPLTPGTTQPPPNDSRDAVDPPDLTDPPINIEDLLPPLEPEPGQHREPDDGLGRPMIDGRADAADGGRQPPCREVYRERDCCQQGRLCAQRWGKLQSKRLAAFTKNLLDITPLYHPDWREELPAPDEDRVDEATARRQGLVLSAIRTWKNVDGAPVFTGSLVRQSSDGKIRLRSATGEEAEFALGALSLDDNYWVSGRPWRNRAGEQIARGRLVDYRWGRVIIADAGGRIRELPIHELGNDEFCYVGAHWGRGVGLPDECRLHGEDQLRNFTLTSFHWTASALCHKPLYFEEVQLERYGHSHGPLAQPVVSTAHFFVNIAILPYKMGINPPHECMYALGYYRPGSCAPYMIPPVPYSIRGGLYQAGAWVGGVAIFP